MARQSPNRPDAEEPAEEVAEEAAVAEAPDDAVAQASDGDGAEESDEPVAEESEDSDAADRTLWDEVRIAPVGLALPAGVGYTLRAYRMSTEIEPTEVDAVEEDDPFAVRVGAADDEDDDEVVILDEEFAAAVAEDEADRAGGTATAEKPDEADLADEDEDKDKGPAEEVPLFLSHRGRLLAFKSPEGLVSFIRSGAPHDMTQLDTWGTLADQVQAEDIAPLDDDSYELDLVVENLRGGHDTWDFDLLIQAGEAARDLGYALRLKPVITALSPGSPLDDLDEALRAASGGGIRGMMGRRRLRKIGAQQASLGWRTIIGKISAAVDWRD